MIELTEIDETSYLEIRIPITDEGSLFSFVLNILCRSIPRNGNVLVLIWNSSAPLSGKCEVEIVLWNLALGPLSFRGFMPPAHCQYFKIIDSKPTY